MRKATLDQLIALVGSARPMLSVAAVALCAVLPLSTAAAGATTTPHTTTPHEHLPHTSSALKDITSFTKTFDAPPPTPGSSSTPVNAQRVRLANALPPSNPLSVPIILLAAALVLFGFLLYPFRKARRKKRTHAHHDDSVEHLVDLVTPSDTGLSEELVLKTGSNR